MLFFLSLLVFLFIIVFSILFIDNSILNKVNKIRKSISKKIFKKKVTFDEKKNIIKEFY